MALDFYDNLNGQNVVQLLGMRHQNVTDAEMATLAGTLGAGNAGLAVWNTTQAREFIWNGTGFVEQAIDVAGDLVFAGVVDASISLDGQVEAIAGYQYVVGTAGTLTATGITFLGGDATVEPGDVFFFTSTTEAYVIQRNNDARVAAIEAKNTEQDGRLDAVEAKDIEQDGRLDGLEARDNVKAFFGTEDLVAGANTITHGLALTDPNSFVINTMVGSSAVSFDVDAIDGNTITLTTLLPVTGVKVTVLGV